MNMRDLSWNAPNGLAYLRCSKDEQRDSIQGQHRLVETQLSHLGKGFLKPPFEDDGRRGSDEERPGLLALLDYCRAHPIKPRTKADFVPIFCQSMDRIGRFLEPMKVFTYLNEFRDLGYDIYLLDERLSFVCGNLGDWIQLAVKSDQATGYSVRLSHDSMRGGIQTAEKGFLAGGSPGYGFDRAVVGPDGEPRARYRNTAGKRVEKYSMDGKLLTVLQPLPRKGKLIAPTLDKSNVDHVVRILGEATRVKAVARLFELFAEGKGLRSVAAVLNAEGYPPAQGRKWVSSSVRSILKNPAYMGAQVYGRRSKSKYHEFSVEKAGESNRIKIERKEIFRKGFVYREMEECVMVHDAHPAIVPKELWTKCQELLEKRAKGAMPKRTGRGARSPYLLTGLIKCARCGYSFQGDTHRRTGWRSYQCGGYLRAGHSICQRATVPAERIETWVVEEMGKRLADGRADVFENYADLERAIAAEIAAQLRGAPSEDDRRKPLEAALAEKRKKIDLILTGLAADNLDVANELIRALKREISTLEGELAKVKVEQRSDVTHNPKALAKESARVLWNLKEVLDDGTIEERRKIIEYFVDGVKVNGAEGWVEAAFFERPQLPAGSFCIMPPTGLEPV